MKKTMRFLSLAALALVGAIMTGCSNEDDFTVEPENKSNVVTLTTTVGIGGGARTRALTAEGVKTFAAGEQLAVIYKNTSGTTVKAVSAALTAGDIQSGSKTATFTFTLENPAKNQDVTYIYPAAMAGTTGVNYAALNSQDGSLSTLSSNLDLATYTGAWNGTSLPSATLTNQLAFLAVTLMDAGGSNDITSSITSMTLKAGDNTYTVSRSAVAGPIYVAIQPTTSANIKVTATDGSTDYTKSLTGKTYEASNGYNVSWRMPEALISNATTLDYGMVVCAAGHLHLAKTAVPSGCTAVGILGKVTATGHGLILALQDATQQSWNTINGWTSVTTYAGTTLKQLPDNTARGSLTSYTILGSTTVSNWCVGQKSDYEAIFTNLGSTTGNPKTYDANVNAYITTGVGGTAMSDRYWSATGTDDPSYSWRFSDGSWYSLTNNNGGRLRPVLAF